MVSKNVECRAGLETRLKLMLVGFVSLHPPYGCNEKARGKIAKPSIGEGNAVDVDRACSSDVHYPASACRHYLASLISDA
jgi:hypothetical protein